MEASRRRDGVVNATSSAPSPTLTVAAVARRLGVAPSTLRTWDRRYQLGPSAHTAGAHRRYSPADVARLMVMRRLTLEGVSPADAAKIAVATPVSVDSPSFDEITQESVDAATFGFAGQSDDDVDSDDSVQDDAAPEADEPDDADEPNAQGDAEQLDAEQLDDEQQDDPRQKGGRRRAAHAVAAAAIWADADTAGHVDPAEQSELSASGAWLGVLRSVGSERSTPGGGRVVAMPEATPQNRGLARAAMSLDTYESYRIVRDAVRREGVVPTWNSMIMPVLRALGERTKTTGDGIDVEHAFSEVILSVMRTVQFGTQPPRNLPTVLMACADSDYHSLPLHALAAALAERGLPTRMLGSGLPLSALAASVRRTGPSVVVLFARMSGADASETESLRRQRPAPRVILAGPGWSPDTIPPFARTASSLIEAVDEVVLAVHA